MNRTKQRKFSWAVFILTVSIIANSNLLAQSIYVPDTTLTHKEQKEAKKEFQREQLKASKRRLVISGNYLFADLKTEVTFTGPNSIFSASIGLEDNLGLPDKSGFFVGSILYRFSPSSGLYSSYYGINRATSGTTDQDYIFLGDTIQAGTKHNTYFNTQVFSIGYLLTILQHKHAFLGVYFNVYIMDIKTGIASGLTQINSELAAFLPLPNFGLIGHVEIKKWFLLGGNVGFFGISTTDYGGYISTFAFEASFKPIHWLSIDLKYQTFDVNVSFPEDAIRTNVEYKFHGPAVGLTLSF